VDANLTNHVNREQAQKNKYFSGDARNKKVTPVTTQHTTSQGEGSVIEEKKLK